MFVDMHCSESYAYVHTLVQVMNTKLYTRFLYYLDHCIFIIVLDFEWMYHFLII